MSEVDNFISSVKAVRETAVEYFTSEEFAQLQASDSPVAAAQKGIDALVGSVLDLVETNYQDLVTAEVDDEGTVTTSIASDLATLYFEDVSN